MGWPDEKTPPFYVHERVCWVCQVPFQGFSRSRYCSDYCKEEAQRQRLLKKWGMI